jgi:hypothetical protein
MSRFAAVRPSGLGRTTFWIVVTATIFALLTWASAVLSQVGGHYPYWEYGTDGMPRPDGIITQQDPPPPGQPGGRTRRPPVYTYKATSRADGSILITRNGVKWVTLANVNHQFTLSDPNGTGHPVVKFDQSKPHAGGPVPPSKIRAQVR